MANTPSDYLIRGSKDIKFLFIKKKGGLGLALIPLVAAVLIFLVVWSAAPMGSYWPLDTLTLLLPITFFTTLYVVTKTTQKVKSNSKCEN